MKASIKYLRELGTQRRTVPLPGPDSIQVARKQSLNTSIMTLLELRKQGSSLMLGAEEREYVNLTKEYRQFDEMKFKAFQDKVREESRARSMKVKRPDGLSIKEEVDNSTKEV